MQTNFHQLKAASMNSSHMTFHAGIRNNDFPVITVVFLGTTNKVYTREQSMHYDIHLACDYSIFRNILEHVSTYNYMLHCLVTCPQSLRTTILCYLLPASVSSSSLDEELSVNPLSISPSSFLSTSSSSLGTSFRAFLACR